MRRLRGDRPRPAPVDDLALAVADAASRDRCAGTSPGRGSTRARAGVPAARRSRRGAGRRGSAPRAAATGTLLVADAWFDVILESHSDELRISMLFAVCGELPLAAVCFWIAYRTERVPGAIVEVAAERGDGVTSRGGRRARGRG